jgi:hypothetical protein
MNTCTSAVSFILILMLSADSNFANVRRSQILNTRERSYRFRLENVDFRPLGSFIFRIFENNEFGQNILIEAEHPKGDDLEIKVPPRKIKVGRDGVKIKIRVRKPDKLKIKN